MRKLNIFLIILFGLFVTTAFTIPKHSKIKVDPKSESEILELVFSILKTRHINPKKIDDDFSKKLFNTYLDSIDQNKIFLLQSDINEFKKYETKLDDQLKENDLTFFFMTYDRIMLRMREGKEMYNNILKNKLDFTIDEDTSFFQDQNTGSILDVNFSKNKDEQMVKWNNLLKSIAFRELKVKYAFDVSQINKENINSIAVNLEKGMETLNSNYSNLSRDEIFEHYINAIIVQFDTHSAFYVPKNRDKYLNRQTGKLEGTGITVMQVDGFIQIKRLIEGGPAWKTNKLNIGDVILKIGQENEYPTNVAGFSIYDVTKLLKGKSGTNLKITIKKSNGTIVEIPLKRDIVSMNDSYIKSCLIKKNNINYGLISFPRFYNDFDNQKARNATQDFSNELEILKQANLKGLILDLRDNEGGSVEAAVKIVGNFITKNPVIQLKSKDNKLNTLESESIKKNWDKNVVVIVNSKTASAAEIITNAFREFNIGIIVGEQTFGKGTIQDFQDLNVFKPAKLGNKDLGAIKISALKFFQLNGKSIQKNGIIPDVVFTKYEKKNREINNPESLQPEEVKPIKFATNNSSTFFSKIIKNSQERIAVNETFKRASNLDFEIDKFNEAVLNFKSLKIEKLSKYISDLTTKLSLLPAPEFDKKREFSQTIEGQKEVQAKPYLLQKRNQWLEDLKTNYQIDESLNILDEMRFLK